MAGAKAAAMGLAYTAVDGDIEAIPINPAGTAGLTDSRLSTSYRRGLSDDNWGYVHFAHPTTFGSFFVGGSYFDAGTIDVTTLSGISETRHAERDFSGVVGAGFGQGWLSGGVAAKIIRMNLAEEASATGYAADAGVLAKTPLTGLSLGASLQNVGHDLKFEQESESLPQRLRAGAAYLLDFARWGGSYKTLFTVDGITEKEGTALHSGVDISHDLSIFEKEGSISLRGGYESDIESYSVGLGIVIHNFSLDYAVRLHSDLDESHFATIGYRFSEGQNDQQPKRATPHINANIGQ
jgi:hypothetical protein